MQRLFFIALISLGIFLWVTDKYYKSKDDLMKKAKCKKYINICATVNIICFLAMVILEVR